jgi:pyrroline-5-carboxylate reductase
MQSSDKGSASPGQGALRCKELVDLDGAAGLDASTDQEANIKAVKGAGIVVLALKPDVSPDVLKEISEYVEDGAVIISIAAGVTIATLESLLPDTVSVIRVMPNTPPW